MNTITITVRLPQAQVSTVTVRGEQPVETVTDGGVKTITIKEDD